MDESLGVWAMEVLHMTTAFGDLYKTSPHPGRFDEMACSCGTHPSAFTKLTLGWLSPEQVPMHIGALSGSVTRRYTLHAVGLLQPSPSGRVTGVRIVHAPQRTFFIEARLRVDAYEKQTAGVSSGIPSEGVVVYENDPQWPLRLRTPVALKVGQMFESTGGLRSVRVRVVSAVAGGFTVDVSTTEHEDPTCASLRNEIAGARSEIAALTEELHAVAPTDRSALLADVRAAKARLTAAREQASLIGCGLDDDDD